MILRKRAALALVYALLGCSALIYVGCAPSHAGKTVGKGTVQVEAGLGGPLLTNFGGAIPVPNVPVGARYGVSEQVDVWSHINLLPTILNGFVAWDAGVTLGIVRSETDGFNLASSVGGVLMTDFREARFSPMFDTALGYTKGRFTPFIGAEAVVDFWGPNMIFNPFLGLEVEFNSVALSAAGYWFTPWFDNFTSPVRYVSPGDMGAIGVLIGFKYRFKPERKREGTADEER